jgi:hypothetical protein
MGFSGFVFIGLGYRKHRRDRLFHYITASVVFVACIAYCKSNNPRLQLREIYADLYSLSHHGSQLGLHTHQSRVPP